MLCLCASSLIEIEKSCCGVELEDEVVNEVDKFLWVEELLILSKIPDFQLNSNGNQDLPNDVLVAITLKELWKSQDTWPQQHDHVS